MILKKQKIQISFGSIVTEIEDIGSVVMIFFIHINFKSLYHADYPQLYMLEEM